MNPSRPSIRGLRAPLRPARFLGALALVLALPSSSCSEPADVIIKDTSVSLGSCNGQTNPESLALWVEFTVENRGDDEVEITSVELVDAAGLGVVSGEQTLASPLPVDAGTSRELSCKDGFAVTFPGDGTSTDVNLRVTYKVGADEVTTIRPTRMSASIFWDNCGTMLGSPKVCGAK